jgi:organic radical activating enzyme
MSENFTLVYEGGEPNQNTAIALAEFLSELEAYCPRQGKTPKRKQSDRGTSQ